MKRSLLVMAALASLTLLPVAPAQAGGGGDCNQGNCGAWDDIPGTPPPDHHHGTVQYPTCSSIPGARKSKPKDDEPAVPGGPPAESWVKITCRTASGGLDSVWAPSSATGDAPGTVSPGVIAQSILASMQLEPITIGMAPAARSYVGVPVWMWADDPGRLDYGPATITAGGVSLTAKVTKVVWSMGDGTSVTCQKGTAWTRAKGGGESPTCGHTYVKQGRYRVTATSYWVATWTGYGQSGTIPFNLSSDHQLEVGEIQVITTGR